MTTTWGSRAFGLLVLAGVLTLALPAWAQACTCYTGLGRCASLGSASAVFEATVDSIELVDMGREDGSVSTADPVLVHLTAVQPIRGEAVDVVVTARSEVSCGYDFKLGERYLIVAEGTADGRATVSKCGLTRPLNQASGLIDYARALDGPSSRTFVWGQVNMPTRWADFEREYAPVPGATVTLDGPEQRTLETDAQGQFAVTDLPHGQYTLTVSWPEGRPYLKPAEPVEFPLAAHLLHACQELSVPATIDSSITGRVVDTAGEPVAGAFVQLGLAEQTDLSRGMAGLGALTDEDGRYLFEGLPPGRYLLGLDVWTRPEDRLGPPTENAPEIVTLPLGAHAEAPVIRKRE